MLYITVAEAAEKWDVSLRQVQRLLAENRIPGAQKFGRAWMLPSDAEKPADPRGRKAAQKSLLFDLRHVIAATAVPMPDRHPDAILNTLDENRLRLIYAAELAYLRGDFRRTMQCYLEADRSDAARLRICPVAIAAAISLVDYPAYMEIEGYLKRCMEVNHGSEIAAAELSLVTAAVNVLAGNMAPGWLKAGDLSMLPPQIRPTALYLRAKYLQCIGQPDTALAVAQTALALRSPEQGITIADLYLRMSCAAACHALEREDEARGWLLDAMRIALPHGFITPFTELVIQMGGLVEQCLEQEFPFSFDAVIGQWKRTWKNRIAFHNQFTKDNITPMLSLREYHIALLVARRVPYEKIAKRYCISVGRLKNIMLGIYQKLSTSGRDELAKYVL